MKNSQSIDEYFYTGSLFSLRIRAYPESVQSIDFIMPGKSRTDKLPRNVRALFMWLDDYSERKTDPSYRIIFTRNSGTVHGLGASEKVIVLDASDCTENELKVYMELVKVPAGETVSYAMLAEKSGITRGARFAGNVMAKNRFPVIVPCHRVIKSDGSMGNYSGGVEIKGMLLSHEAGGFSPALV